MDLTIGSKQMLAGSHFFALRHIHRNVDQQQNHIITSTKLVFFNEHTIIQTVIVPCKLSVQPSSILHISQQVGRHGIRTKKTVVFAIIYYEHNHDID